MEHKITIDVNLNLKSDIGKGFNLGDLLSNISKNVNIEDIAKKDNKEKPKEKKTNKPKQ